MEMPVDGVGLTLLVGCALVGSVWPFSKSSTQELRAPDFQDKVGDLTDSLVSQEVAIFTAAQALNPVGESWDANFAKKRAAVRGTLTLSHEEVELLLRVMRGCADEFDDNWSDFETVALGGLHWFKTDIRDLEAYSLRLERAHQTSLSSGTPD